MEKKSCDVFGACCRPEKTTEENFQYYPEMESQQNLNQNQNTNYSGYFIQEEQNQNMNMNMNMNMNQSLNQSLNMSQQYMNNMDKNSMNQGRYESYTYQNNFNQPESMMHQEKQYDSYFSNNNINNMSGDVTGNNDGQNYTYTYNVLDEKSVQQMNNENAESKYLNNQYIQQQQQQHHSMENSQHNMQRYEDQFMNQNEVNNNSQQNVHHESQYSQYNYYNAEGEDENKERPIVNIKGDQPVFSVPVYQDKYLRDRIIEVPQYEVQDVIQPKVYTQETKHEIPTVELIYKEKPIEISQPRIVEKPVEVDVPIGYTPLYEPKWDVREVPRPVPKYMGSQKVIEVEVPQIKYINKFVEKEILVDVKEKIVPKITEVEKPVDVVRYKWKEQYQDVPVYKYVPKIDVELDCPPPLIVPYPESHFQNTAHIVNPNQTAADIPKEVLMKNVNISKIANVHVNEQMKKSLLDIARSSSASKQEPKKKASRWAFWRTNKDKEEKKNDNNEIDPETGYPKAMPKDFAQYFQKDLRAVKNQMRNGDADSRSNKGSVNTNMENTPVHPTVEYLGKIDKAPIDGGKLDSISFKLHAIEVHQFIPVPSLPKPKFLDLVTPDKIENNDISCLENVFGSVPEGWVDPNITGYIAPMMQDVLQGNIKPENPIFNKINIGANTIQLMPLSSLSKRNASNSVTSKEMQESNISFRTDISQSKNSLAYS